MDSFIKWMDTLPLWAKVLFALFLDIIWGVYRLLKAVSANDTVAIIIDVLLIVPGCGIMWIVDTITLAVQGKVIDFVGLAK